ncbi:hypothetical protein ACM55F_16870 [Flavobacterium sp. XS2P12]|uniref:hypothetical protein n=1 Tax=Flavobacterium melibiosi TaxID=3398734 RepID=UPI003A835EDE
MELFPADRFKIFHKIAFFQDKKGASAGRSFFSGKKCNSISKGFPLSSGLEIGETISFGFYDLKKRSE